MTWKVINVNHIYFYRADPGAAARNALVMVFPDGTLTWVPHSIFKSSCSIDVENFPFDNQTCTMWFGSWTHPISDIDIDLAFPGGIDLSTFKSDYKVRRLFDYYMKIILVIFGTKFWRKACT